MSDKVILTKAIEKALANGWDDPFGIKKFNLVQKDGAPSKENSNKWSGQHGFLGIVIKNPWWYLKVYKSEIIHLNEIFFSHTWNFYYGTSYSHNISYHLWGEDWKYHVQQMVIADDPIAYLGEHLPA